MRFALFALGLLLTMPALGQEHRLVPVRRPIAPFLQPDYEVKAICINPTPENAALIKCHPL